MISEEDIQSTETSQLSEATNIVDTPQFYWLHVRCLNCSLHFNIATERKDEWEMKVKTESPIYCPECGSAETGLKFDENGTVIGGKVVRVEIQTGFIFQYVGGF